MTSAGCVAGPLGTVSRVVRTHPKQSAQKKRDMGRVVSRVSRAEICKSTG